MLPIHARTFRNDDAVGHDTRDAGGHESLLPSLIVTIISRRRQAASRGAWRLPSRQGLFRLGVQKRGATGGLSAGGWGLHQGGDLKVLPERPAFAVADKAGAMLLALQKHGSVP